MKYRWAALVIVLALGVIMPRSAAAQGETPPAARERSPRFDLGQNYPNPFNPTTTIPFVIGDPPICVDGEVHRVTLQVFNVLAQWIANPILQGGDVAAGQPMINVPLRCGAYTAFWDGKIGNTGREVASGVYYIRLIVDGKVRVNKAIVTK